MTEKIEWYKEVLELEPNSRVFFPLAKMLVEAGRTDQAVATLEKGLERHPEYLEARLFLIEVLYKNNMDAACNVQVRELSRMFASYAGFWQAWAACLAQEPSEEDAASLLRFLAANFIAGPLKLHDVINRGLASIIAEKSKAHTPAAAEEVTACQKLLEETEENTTAETENENLEIIPDHVELAPEAMAANPAAVETELPENPKSSFTEASLPDVEFENDSLTLSEVQVAESDAIASNESLFDEAVIDVAEMSRPGEDSQATQEAGEKQRFYAPEDQYSLANDSQNDKNDFLLADSEDALQPESAAENGYSDIAFIDNVESVEDSEFEPKHGAAGEADSDMGGAEAQNVELQADTVPVSEEILDEIDIPEVPDLDNQGDFLVPEPDLQNRELSEEEAFDSMIDNLAAQSRELSEVVIAMPDETGQMDTVADLSTGREPAEEDAELDEIFADSSETDATSEKNLDTMPSSSVITHNFAEDDDNREETISLRTRSMAEVLAEQGDIQGALDIYHELAETVTDAAEAEDIRQRMATLINHMDKPQTDATNDESDKLIGMLEALAKRVEARVAN